MNDKNSITYSLFDGVKKKTKIDQHISTFLEAQLK